MTKTSRYVGGPGTGKTFVLEQMARQEITENGKSINDMMILSFSNAQCLDLQKKMGGVFPDTRKDILKKHIKTIHGVALSACIQEKLIERQNNGSINVIDEAQNQKHYKEFCKKQGLSYDPRFTALLNNPDDAFYARAIDVPTGNAVFLLSRYIRNMADLYIDDWNEAANALHLRISRHHDVAAYLDAWTRYKISQQIYEHDDYVALAHEANLDIPESTVFIDEFQDLSPMQFALVNDWITSGNHDNFYVAGDPNQAIYGFRGADPRFLKEMNAEDLGAWGPGQTPRSHRCPHQVIKIADHTLDGQSNMTPALHEGMVRITPIRDIRQITDIIIDYHQRYHKVLVLARFSAHVMKFSTTLSAAGIPHTSLSERRDFGWSKTKTGNGERVDMRLLLEQCRFLQNPDNHNQFDDHAAHQFLEIFRATDICPTFFNGQYPKRQGETRIALNDIFSAFGLPMAPSSVGVIINRMKIPAGYKERLNAAIHQKIEIDPSQIVIDTIHAAKGYESPAVILCADYLKDRMTDFYHDTKFQAEERRIFYVGCTRASKELCVINTAKNRIFPGLVGYAS